MKEANLCQRVKGIMRGVGKNTAKVLHILVPVSFLQL